MDWSNLDLRKAALVKKEVDVALLALSKCQNDRDSTKKDILILSIQARIDDLEEFCIAYDSDDRKVLFEKQLIRLRKAVQSQQVQRPVVPVQLLSPDKRADRTLSLSALNDSRSSPASPGSPGSRASLPPPPPPQLPPGFAIKRFGVTGVHSHPSSVAASIPEVMYDWEVRRKEAKEKKRIFLDGSSYCPTKEPGIYVREIREPVDEEAGDDDQFDEDGNPRNPFGAVVGVVTADDLSEKFIDFQMILTADEMSALVSRRRITSRADIGHAKSQLVSTNVHIATPFVDQSRIMKEHLRPVNPEKWVHKTSLRPNK